MGTQSLFFNGAHFWVLPPRTLPTFQSEYKSEYKYTVILSDEVYKIVKFTKIESRMVVTRSFREGEMGVI